MRTLFLWLSLLTLCASGTVDVASAQTQTAPGEVEIIKLGWSKVRLRPRPSLLPLVGPEELVRQSQREAQLSAARNANNQGAAGRIETQMKNHEDATAKARQTPRPEDGFRYTVTLRNNGSKTIKSIDWDYLFIDPTNRAEVSRHQFTSDETIKPGKTKEVGVLYEVPPVKTISAKLSDGKKPLPYEEQVVLMRIQYSDGSHWQRP